MLGFVGWIVVSSLGSVDRMYNFFNSRPIQIEREVHLGAALRQRLETARLVAMAKHNSGAPVEDKGRERQVIFGAVRLAVKEGANVEVVLKVFTAQIEANKIAQRAFLKQWSSRPPFNPAPDLAKEVRPQLDRLTPIIVRGLKKQTHLSLTELRAGPDNTIYREAWRAATKPLRP